MAGFNNMLFVFDKYDSKGSELKKDFNFTKLPHTKNDKTEINWKTINDEQSDDDDDLEEEDKPTGEITSHAACHRLNRTEYLLAGG